MRRLSLLILGLGLVLLALLMALIGDVNAHIEDICVTPPGENCPKCGIYNFYTVASRIGCKYNQNKPKCVISTTVAQSQSGFLETSACRGIIHFNAIYFIAVALGFKQEIAHAMSAFSQAIDFVQYRAVDSCGRNMSNGFWTPPMRGLLRTAVTYGGTNRHLGVPWVGMFDSLEVQPANLNQSSLQGEILIRRRKIYKGSKYPSGCRRLNYKETNGFYAKRCPGLNPDLNDMFYEGALSSSRKWAFMETDTLCVGGFTELDKSTGSVFSGSKCPTKGKQYTVNVGPIVQGPIPISGPQMEFGDQVIHYDCLPNCSASDYTVKPGSVIYAKDFGAYLKQQSEQHGYATLSDPPGPVPEAVARFGIYLHWVADRASHWYCCDASQSGIVTVPASDGDYYNGFMYMGTGACNFINHGMVHYWEQGVNRLAPGSYFALLNTYKEVEAFRKKFLHSHPEWFRPNAKVLGPKKVIGTKTKPGVLYRVTNIREANKRFQTEVGALKNHKLPPMPGFETMCKEKGPKSG